MNSQHPDGGVLAAIDAAIDQICACDCGQPIPPGGASAYFASPECQRRWHGARSTDPQDVYRRLDADMALRIESGAAAADQPPHPHSRHTHARIGLVREAEHAEAPGLLFYANMLVPLPCNDASGLGYRRRCSTCQDDVIPVPTRDTANDDLFMTCPNPACIGPIAGPVFTARIETVNDPYAQVLILTDGWRRAETEIDGRAIALAQHAGATAVRALAAEAWARLEGELVRLRTERDRAVVRWYMDDRIAAMCIDPASLFRNINT